MRLLKFVVHLKKKCRSETNIHLNDLIDIQSDLLMKWLRKRVQNNEILLGTWLNLGSSLTAEMAGMAGFDWVVIDLEHGAGEQTELLHQLQALAGSDTSSLVRVACNDAARIKRVLDLGPTGIVVPYVNTVSEAKKAVAAVKYPSRGVRGVSKMSRASGFGTNFDDYFAQAGNQLLTVVQIETQEALDNLDAIAAVDGVDVLFVGPLDLTVDMEIPQRFDDPRFTSALDQVIAVSRKHHKTAGIFSYGTDHVSMLIHKGFTFIAAGSDSSLVNTGMKKLAETINKHKN